MELPLQFRNFIKDIKPTDIQASGWRDGYETLRDRLLNFEPLSSLTASVFLQGSIRRSTSIKPVGDKRPDIDLVIVTNINIDKVTPLEAQELFHEFLDKYYAGKWKPQGRSLGIELSYVDLDLVITSLPVDTDRYAFLRELYNYKTVTTRMTLDERNGWVLNAAWDPNKEDVIDNPAFQIPIDDKDWKDHPLRLPDKDLGEWTRTHPLIQIKWTSEKNDRCYGHFVNVVKAIKWWKQQQGTALPKYPKGYPLEHLVGICCPDGIQSVAEGVTRTFERIRDEYEICVRNGETPELNDHGVPEHDVMKRVEPKDFALFYEGCVAAAGIARKALDHTQQHESSLLWRSLFGNTFPEVPKPSGGNDQGGAGFTPPSKPAVPQQSDRFS